MPAPSRRPGIAFSRCEERVSGALSGLERWAVRIKGDLADEFQIKV
jgi:hypothetical protein